MDHKKYTSAGKNFNVGGQKGDVCGETEKEKCRLYYYRSIDKLKNDNLR